tara:strand:- start:56 stop:478 length:423 start_codon:yes stop_codon:yes gene_type:complete
MAKTAQTTAPQGPTQPTLQGPLIVNGTHNWAALTAFINKHAGGNTHNISIVPLGNVAAAPLQAVPFGYNGKAGGVRATIQNHMLSGPTLFAALNAGAKHKGGQSKAKPICLLALLNGGYTASAPTWGTPFVKLVVTAPPK